ncbi:MAG: hypothetical protein AB7U51_12415 [Arcobacter sp.]|uniref:hypothetical protein n=1 Tax=Arcobacter sp. TaxID=1872629 RepID=UPI003D03FCB0
MNEDIKLPKRSDTIYKEIEGYSEKNSIGFKDYEYTNCIAYEMAIRNDEVISLKNLLIETQFEYSEKDKEVEGFTKEFFDLFDYYNKKEKIILKKLEKFGFDEFTLLPVRIDFKDGIETKKNQNKKKITTIIQYKYPKNTLFSDCILKKASCDYDFLQYALKTGQLEDENEIKSNFKSRFRRPILKFRHNEFNLKINPNLPKEELIAYILKIKEEYDSENSILKSPIELLGEWLAKAEVMKSKAIPKDKNKRKKALADAFFIYDLWKILEVDYSEKTKKLKVEQEKEIKAIKQNINYDKYDKKSLIDEIKSKYSDLLNQYSKLSLKTEIANQLNISIDTVDKLHTLMIKYIDSLKYKELITGISN